MNTSHIKTHHVKRSFSNAANSYDAHAVLQREIADSTAHTSGIH